MTRQQAETSKRDLLKAQQLTDRGKRFDQQAKYTEAEASYREALRLREQILGPEHPKTLTSLHNLADVYLDRAHYAEAEALYNRVLAIETRIGVKRDLEYAKTVNNLGVLKSKQGKYAEAEILFQQALAIAEQSEDPSSQNLLTYLLDGLGTIAEDRASYRDAEVLYQRALALREHLLGEKIEIAHCLSKIASIYEIQRKYEEAEELYQRVLSIANAELRPGHPDRALFLNDQGLLAAEQRQFKRAESLYQQSLSIYEQALGPQHPHVADVCGNLGRLYQKTGNTVQAEALLRRAVAINIQARGTEHPDTALSHARLADLLTDLGVYEEAESLFQQALIILLQVLSADHPDVERVQEKYDALQRLQKAGEPRKGDIGFHARAGEGADLSTNEQWNGMEHWDSASVLERSASELVIGLELTWHMIASALEHWTPTDLASLFPSRPKDDPVARSRQWIVYHVLEHDIFHGGELSSILGAHGLAAVDLD